MSNVEFDPARLDAFLREQVPGLSGAMQLERISGRIDAEAVLDRVFSSFCIGK